ncbi:uncharacterized protein TNCV_219301 [Trichonephila clavipes]|nr:uncharacterized protein TNCV_219301 [Trichonephila clavipes]
MSTDQKPQHKKCPSGIDSWCFYKSLARGKKPGFHKDWVKTPINEEYLPKILPIYQRLASSELLSRVSAADKGCRVYRLDPRPDAVALDSGCTLGCQNIKRNDSNSDENITKIVRPALKLLLPLRSVPKPTIFSLVPAVFKSSTSTQAQLLPPSTSSVLVTSSSKSQPPIPLKNTAPTTSNNLSTSAASSSSKISMSTPLTASHVQNTTTTSNTIPSTSQDAKQTSKLRKKKRPPTHIYQYKTKNRN